MSDTHHYFLSSVRQGFATAIENSATDTQRSQIDVRLQVVARNKDSDGWETVEISQSVELWGPGDVIGFQERIVARCHPSQDVGDFEPNYFPAIEFADPDFPWRYTTYAADAESGRLDPWITLIVLAADTQGEIRQEFIDGGRSEANLPPSIIVSNTVLPDLRHAWRWAHVDITDEQGKESSLEQLLRNKPEHAVSRLLCPRRLAPKMRYTAFVVPTFKLGVLAGLGHDLDSGVSASDFAWSGDSDDERLPYAVTPQPEWPASFSEGVAISLPYYYRWEFGTGLRGDFERLVRLLEPRQLSSIGLRDIDCARPGYGARGVNRAGLEAPQRYSLAMEGALQSLDTHYTSWGRDPAYGSVRTPPPLQQDLANLLNNTEAQRIALEFTSSNVEASAIVIEQSGDTAVRFTFQTSTPCKVHIDYGVTSAYDRSVNVEDLKASHQVDLEGLSCADTYHFRIIVEADDGSSGGSEDLTFDFPIVPSIVPPIYGRWHRGRRSVTAYNQEEWLDVLNLDPRHRAAAGLGAEVIRKQQEPLMASAWEQLGAIETVNDILRRAQFGRENALSLYKRFNQLPTEDFLRLSAATHKRIMIEDDERDSSMTLRHYLETRSLIPPAAFDPAFRRIMRPRGPIRKRQHAGRSANLLSLISTGERDAAGSALQKPKGLVKLCDITSQVADSLRGYRDTTRGYALTGCTVNADAGCPVMDTGPLPNCYVELIGLPQPLAVGETANLTAIVKNEHGDEIPDQEINWSSSDASIAAVDSTGLVTGVGEGSVEITASAGVCLGDTARLTVGSDQAACSVEVEPSQLTIDVGDTLELSATVKDSAGNVLDQTVTWSTSNSAIVSVDSNGLATGQAVGDATISAKSGECDSGAASVSVTASQQHGDDLLFCDGRITADQIMTALDEDSPFQDIDDVPDSQAMGDIASEALDNWFDYQGPHGESPPVQPEGFVEEVRDQLYPELDPSNTILERTENRLRLAGDIAEYVEEKVRRDRLETILWAPEFPKPMYEAIRDLSQDLLLPGVSTIPNNSIGLLETNRRFVEAFMCGCNHEFSTELLWRGYPTDQRGSYFRQFWDTSQYVPSEDELREMLTEWLISEYAVYSVNDLHREVRERICKRYLDRYLEQALSALLGKWLANPSVSDIDDLSDEQIRLLNLQSAGWEGIAKIAETELNELTAELIKYQRLSEKLKDIAPLVQWWNNRLGENGTRPVESLILVVRGDLLKRYPNACIYAIDAVPSDGADGEAVPGLPEYLKDIKDSNGDVIQDDSERELKIKEILNSVRRVFPVFRVNMPADLTFFSFPFTEESARGAGEALGMYFLIEEEVAQPRFGLDAPTTGPLQRWDDLSWSHFGLGESIGAYLDSGTLENQPTQDSSAKQWSDDDSAGSESSSATRAWITMQKPVRIAIHANKMIPIVTAYFEVMGPDPDDRFIIKLVDQEKIEHARNLVQGLVTERQHIMGVVVAERAVYNPDWSYHLEPKSIEFFDMAVEVCDATMQYVEDHLNEVGGDFLPGNVWCPWGSLLVREITDLQDIQAIGSIICFVENDSGDVINNVTVSVGSISGRTDLQGRAVLDGVAVGRKTVNVTHVLYGAKTKTVTLNAGETKAVHFTVVAGTCIVKGAVQDTQGNRVAGATVTIGDKTTTAVNGSYIFSDVPVGRQAIKVEHSLYKTQQKLVILYVDRTFTIDFALERVTCSVAGTVKREDGNPITDVTVSVSGSEVKTDGQGYYTIAGISPGRRIVVANHPRYNVERKVVMLVANRRNNVDFILTAATTGTITGTVKDSMGNNVSLAEISAGGMQTGTSRLGRYTLRNVPAGRHAVRVTHPDYAPDSKIILLTGGEVETVDFTIWRA
jgi:hypothetical protein